jgi:hypothetical protein
MWIIIKLNNNVKLLKKSIFIEKGKIQSQTIASMTTGGGDSGPFVPRLPLQQQRENK